MNNSEKYFKQKLVNQDITALVVISGLGFFFGAAYLGMVGVFLDVVLTVAGAMYIRKKHSL